jgi:hypothetical protein
MATSLTDTYSLYLERVRPTLEKLFEQTDQIAARVKKSTEAVRISRWFYRVPLKIHAGLNYGKVGIDGGSAGIGTGALFTHLRGGYFSSKLAGRITMEQEETSAPEQAVVNVLTDLLSNAVIEAGVMDDIGFHTDGTGVLTNAATATNSTTTLTFGSATDFLKLNNLRVGMAVDVWNSALNTVRVAATAAPILISALDLDNNIVTFNQTVTAIASTDKITFAGLAAYGPATPTSYSSTYPVTGTGGVGGDSFRHGFPYMTDVSANYFYGVSRSTYPQLQAVRVNANTNPFEWDHIHRMVAKITNKRDGDAWKKLFGIINMAQRTQIADLGVAITYNLMSGEKFGQTKDLVPDNMGYADTVNVGGLPCVLSKRQDRARMDFINTDKIIRAQLHDLKFLPNESGGYMHVGHNSSGEVCTYKEFFIIQSYDYVCTDAGAFARIDNLTLPSGWDA